MTANTFLAICGEYLIDPDIALENEAVKEALLARNDKLVRKILEEEF